MRWRRKPKRSHGDLKAAVDNRTSQDSLEFDADEITDLIDLSLERLKRDAKTQQRKIKSTVKQLKTLREPTPGPEEKLG